jgi:hypothetical protein
MINSHVQRSAIHFFVVSFACMYYVASAPLLLGHYDLGWHLAAGDVIREQGRIPFHDPWSFTAGERQWYNVSWLWDVIASLIFQYAGFNGLILLVLACGAVLAGYLVSICLSSGASTTAVCIAVLSCCLLYPTFATYPDIYLTASPNLMTMLFCVLFYAACLKRRKLFLLPAIMALWANLHGGFLLGLIIIAVCGFASILKRDWVNFKIYAVTGVSCLAATFINPLGWHIYEGLATVLGHFSQAYISEWWPYFRDVAVPGSIPGIVYILAFVALELGHRGPCPLEARLLSWLFLFMGLLQFRYMAFFFIFSTVPVALHLSQLLPKQRIDLDSQKSLLAAGAIAVCALPLIYLYAPALGLPQMLSERDVRYLATNFPHARLLNHWNYGGLLIFYNRGAIPVFVDGRAATAYPDDVLRDYFKLAEWEIDERAWDMVIEKYRIDTILWVKAHDELRRFLVGKRDWKEAYAGSYASIYIKP